MLSKVSVAGTAYAQACAEKAKDGAKRSPCGEFFRQLFQRAIEYDFERMFTRLVRQQTSILKNTRWWPKVADVAIDIHYVTRYDTKKSEGTIVSKIKNMIQRGEKYMTAQIANTGATLAFAALHMKKGDKNVDFVRKIIKKCNQCRICVEVFLLDREFFATDVIHLLKTEGKTFLIPCKKTSIVKKYLDEFRKGKRDKVSQGIITDKNDNYEKYTIIITRAVKDGKKQLHAFATNNENIDIEKYKRRWVIETGYRNIDDMRLKTSSRDSRVRLLLFIYSVLFYNAWILSRFVEEDDLFARCSRITQAVFKKVILAYLETFLEQWPPPMPPGFLQVAVKHN